ncbi:MAG TPA: hypothetical protein VG895_04785 [Patescibacteria group bacterium]|nr:hypothetical protein [Patescibacteria group bacterium]
MSEDKNLPIPQDNEPNLSAFEDALHDVDMEGIEEPKNERQVIRDVLDRLSKEYGIEFSIHDGKALGSPMALNHRLNSLDVSSPQSLSQELTDAIQSNKMTYELGDKLTDKLTDEEELELFDYEQLEGLLYDVYQVTEVVLYLEEPKTGEEDDFVQQQHEDVIADIKSHDILLGSLHKAGQKVEEYIQTKPQRDNEPVNVTEKLSGYLNRWSDKSAANLQDLVPDSQATIGQVTQRLNRAISKLPQNTTTRRVEVNNIIKRIRGCIGISPSIDTDEWKLVVNDQAIKDVEIMIEDISL